MHLLSRHGDFLQAGEASKFVSLGVGAGLVYWLAVVCFARGTLPVRQSAWVFWTGAVILRLVILPVLPGDDLWRYRWEGLIQLHGFNPYALSPDAPILVPLRDADWLKINHRNFPAIYPPLAQICFAALALLGNSAWLYKVVFLLADLACCGVLRRLATQAGTGGERAAWYAWNPLVVYAFAGAAHFDCLMILALLGAVWALEASLRGTITPVRGVSFDATPSLLWLSVLLLGVAAGIKIVPLALFPVWAFTVGSWRRALGLFPVFMAPLAASAIAYGFPRVPVFSNLRQFGNRFRVNDPIWSALETVTGSHGLANNAIYEWITVFACLFLAFRFRRDWRRGLLWVWGTVLLLSPVVHAWYVVWVLPVAAWRGPGARPWFILSVSIFGYFLLWEINHESGRPWEEPPWLRGLIYLPPAVAAATAMVIGRRPAPTTPGRNRE